MQFVKRIVATVPVATKRYPLTMYSYFLAPLVMSSLATQPDGVDGECRIILGKWPDPAQGMKNMKLLDCICEAANFTRQTPMENLNKASTRPKHRQNGVLNAHATVR